jgi:acyl-CoA reductase-like NAD-dependent aldehyde dehydrogenase
VERREITEIPLASADDLDEAFAAAAAAQRDWAARLPADRAAVMRAAAAVLESRKEEITGWLIRESGGTRAKAALEWDLVHSVLLEAASIPHRTVGTITPSDIPGKENRIIVDETVHDQFVSLLTSRVRSLRAGDPAAPDTDIGPVINGKQLAAIQDKVKRAVAAGARQLLGGPPAGPAGLLLPPHVLLGTNDVATAREEVFGPVITVIPAAGEEEALRIANDTEYGLSSAVFTRDPDRGTRFALRGRPE